MQHTTSRTKIRGSRTHTGGYHRLNTTFNTRQTQDQKAIQRCPEIDSFMQLGSTCLGVATYGTKDSHRHPYHIVFVHSKFSRQDALYHVPPAKSLRIYVFSPLHILTLMNSFYEPVSFPIQMGACSSAATSITSASMVARRASAMPADAISDRSSALGASC